MKNKAQIVNIGMTDKKHKNNVKNDSYRGLKIYLESPLLSWENFITSEKLILTHIARRQPTIESTRT